MHVTVCSPDHNYRHILPNMGLFSIYISRADCDLLQILSNILLFIAAISLNVLQQFASLHASCSVSYFVVAKNYI